MMKDLFEYDNIKKIIQKYYEGKTSLEEENILKAYFSSDNIDPEFEKYKIEFSVIHRLFRA